MNRSSRSSQFASTGICTAPMRVSAPTRTTASRHVGNCHATRVPGATPTDVRYAAQRSDWSRYSRNVSRRPCSSTPSSASGTSWARSSTRAQIVRASGGMQKSVEEQRAALVGHLVDRVSARGLLPPHAHPDRVAHEAVDDDRVELLDEAALVDAGLDRLHPDLLRLARGALH